MQITILMPVKNGARFLQHAIKDIETNLMCDDEVIVVDDNSIDGTTEILKDWAESNQQVKVINNPRQGLVNALNLGIQESSNSWIARFDVDDRYSFQRLKVQRNLISESTAAIFCDYEVITLGNRSLGVIPSMVFPTPTAISLFFNQQTPHPGALLNRDAVLNAGGYRPMDFPAEDLSLWLRLIKHGEIVSAPDVLLKYRLSNSSVSRQFRGEMITIRQKIYKEIGVDHRNVTHCLEHWRSMFEEYSEMKFGVDRKILFYRNLKYASSVSDDAKSSGVQLGIIKNELIKSRSLIHGVSRLALGKTLRNINRLR